MASAADYQFIFPRPPMEVEISNAIELERNIVSCPAAREMPPRTLPKDKPVRTTTCSRVRKYKAVPKLKFRIVTTGICYIFDHLKSRSEQSKEHIRELIKTLSGFDLETEIFGNPTVEFIKKTIQKIESKNFNPNTCIVIVILGNDGCCEAVNEKQLYSIDDDILSPMLCNPTLDDKPKIFFIEAGKDQMKQFKKASQIGTPCDIIKFYSTFEEIRSPHPVRKTLSEALQQSIFIPTLCKHMEKYGRSKDILAIIDKVIEDVGMSTIINNYRQVLSYTSSLTVPIVFGSTAKDEGERVGPEYMCRADVLVEAVAKRTAAIRKTEEGPLVHNEPHNL